MSLIAEMLARLAPQGVGFRPIGEVADCVAGATPASGNSAYWENGTIPWMSSGEVNKGTIEDTDVKITQAGFDSCSTKMVPNRSVVIALAGQGKTRGTVARTRLSLCTNQSLCAITPRDDSLDSDFLFHYLRGQYQKLRSASSGEGARGGLNLRIIRDYRVPVPPLEVQTELVQVLDQFVELEAEMEAELEAELEARRQQYEHYRRELLNFDSSTEWAALGVVADYVNGKAHERLADPQGEIPMVTARFVSRNGEANRFVRAHDVKTPALAGDTALVLSDLPGGRALARTFFVDRDDSYAINQRVARLRVVDTDRVDPKYLCHVLNRNPGLLVYDNGADQTHLSKAQVTGLRIPIPAVQEQRRVAERLDQFEALVNDLSIGLQAELSARRQQYEYCRDKLLTFEEAPS